MKRRIIAFVVTWLAVRQVTTILGVDAHVGALFGMPITASMLVGAVMGVLAASYVKK